MTDLNRFNTWMGRLAIAAFAVLALVVIVTVRPWSDSTAALRPDTGERAAALDEEAIPAVLGELLARVYAAFGAEEEGAIYDGLASAVSDALLSDLYLQRRLAQVTAPPETAGSAEITDVTLNELDVLNRGEDGYRLAATWTVTGILGHEDHRHERVNRYSAQMTLGPSAGEWRLTAFDLDQVQRQDVPLFLDPFE
ncbi:hypothetical protein [Oceanibium sediminis]|uniref:hypothetical protein n=1 Tax=Oceanibium sediminis TaxID=2026339 RepID=UPI000DD3CDF5|nr:hypothetical protein [Oceanibium sediminis]